jgi:hypothetical protein
MKNVINAFNDYHPIKYDALSLLNYWLTYMNQYPNLKTYCQEDYQDQWKDIALEKVFNYDQKDFLRMKKAQDILLSTIHSFDHKAKLFFGVDTLPIIDWIIYHGLGNGAGGYTNINGKKTIVFGLEKIVELGWDSQIKLEDLLVHEYSHYFHEHIREQSLETPLDFYHQYIFRLYVEGLATYAEKMMHGREVSMPDWYDNCLKKEQKLKQTFINHLMNHNKDIQHMYGDWYPVLGEIETAYFLGMQMIKLWHKEVSIKTIMKASLDTIEDRVLKYLERKGE